MKHSPLPDTHTHTHTHTTALPLGLRPNPQKKTKLPTERHSPVATQSSHGQYSRTTVWTHWRTENLCPLHYRPSYHDSSAVPLVERSVLSYPGFIKGTIQTNLLLLQLSEIQTVTHYVNHWKIHVDEEVLVFYGAPQQSQDIYIKKDTSANPVRDSQRISVWCNGNILCPISFRLS